MIMGLRIYFPKLLNVFTHVELDGILYPVVCFADSFPIIIIRNRYAPSTAGCAAVCSLWPSRFFPIFLYRTDSVEQSGSL